MDSKNLQIIKRDGSISNYNSNAIYKSLSKANVTCEQPLKDENIKLIVDKVNNIILSEVPENELTVYKVEEILNTVLMENKDYFELYKKYNKYKFNREKTRLMNTNVFKAIGKIAEETDRDNANVGNNFSAKLLRIASEANKYYNLSTMNKNEAREHEIKNLYYHDLDAYNLTTNCLHINLATLLANGFNTGYGTLRSPRRIESAVSLACIILQSSQNDMYGGQSFPNFDTDLAPYLRKTLKEQCREYIEDEVIEVEWANTTKENDIELTTNEIEKRVVDLYNRVIDNDYVPMKHDEYIVVRKTKTHLRHAMSNLVYNLNTMHSRAGSQVPFSSLNIGLPTNTESALICEYLLTEYEKGLGKGEQPIFPNIIFRVKSGVNRNPGDKYYYLFKLACKVAAKRMNPTFMNMDSTFNLKWYEKGYIPATMGCRTYLMSNVNGEPGVDGRGNICGTTIDLPRIAIKLVRKLGEDKVGTEEIINAFFEEFDKGVNKAKDSLLSRYKRLCKLKVKDIPFSAGQGLLKGSEHLGMQDSIEPILKQGTYGIGFIGIAETLKMMYGYHHGEDEKALQIAYRIVRYLRAKTDEFTEKYKLNFSCYATPAEGLSGVFVTEDKDLFGVIPGVTDKGYYTNSFHIPVEFKIDIASKLEKEAPFHSLCNGGHISYVEIDGTPNGDVIERIIRNAYDTTDISYIGVNFHIRYCKHCFTYVKSESSTVCPYCGSNEFQGVSRVTGYLGLDERFGYGKSNERKARTSHADESGNSNYIDLGKRTYSSIK